MKNIHLIPTDKPSRLHITDTLNLYPNGILRKSQGLCKNQHIYITSDEEIKEGGWHYNLALNYLEKTTAFDNGLLQEKIILTTNQNLIADGIQSIDDEFLEWFVKNPSCKWVKVEPLLSNNGRALFGYKIIIPKEEPKQETLQEYLQICKDCGSKEVARCKWVNVNTEEIYSADSGTTLEWCFDCKSETNIINKKDYETKI